MGATALANGINGLTISTSDIQFGDTPSLYQYTNGSSDTPSSIRSNSPSQMSSSTLAIPPEPQQVLHRPNLKISFIYTLDGIVGKTSLGKRVTFASISRCNNPHCEFPTDIRPCPLPKSITLPQFPPPQSTTLPTLHNQPRNLRSQSDIRRPPHVIGISLLPRPPPGRRPDPDNIQHRRMLCVGGLPRGSSRLVPRRLTQT